jgi:fibronectin type 3 domain-containing protein
VTRLGQSPNVDLTWNAASGATEYEVFRSVNGGAYSSLGKTKKTDMNDSTRDNGTYRYYVVAINSCGNSSNSSVVDITR